MTTDDRTARKMPKGYRMSRSVNKDFVLSDDYQHWTVADVIENLREYPQDARVWLLTGANTIAPLEMMAGSEGEVFL